LPNIIAPQLKLFSITQLPHQLGIATRNTLLVKRPQLLKVNLVRKVYYIL